MQGPELKCLYAKIHGRVHGVGFRYSTILQAQRLSLTGYTKNEYDGTVEVEAEGYKDKLDKLLIWLRSGPPMAHVTNVEYNFRPYKGNYKSFSMKY